MDIVTHCRVSRYLHNDLPLGNPLGPPFDHATQKHTVAEALKLASSAQSPIIQTGDAVWPGDSDWRRYYNRVDDANRAELAAMGDALRARRARDKANGLVRQVHR